MFVCVCRMQGRGEKVPKPSVIASLSTASFWSEHQLASREMTPISRGDKGGELKDTLRG